jgi:hypothetical protein
MRSLTALLLLAAGCGLYHQEDDVECRAAPELAPGEQLRDPVTGQCRASTCGPCTPCPLGAPSENPVGSSVCGGPCEALSEAACLDTRSCHTAFRTDAQGVAAFVGCWATAAGKPPSSASDCTQLDVQSCSFRDECSPFYAGASTDAMSFDRCELEREGCEAATCGAPPPCPSNSVPSTRNGCYTGRCMARSQCPQK